MTEFQQTPSSLICFADKDIAGTEYIKHWQALSCDHNDIHAQQVYRLLKTAEKLTFSLVFNGY